MEEVEVVVEEEIPSTISSCLQHSTIHLLVRTKSIWRQNFEQGNSDFFSCAHVSAIRVVMRTTN